MSEVDSTVGSAVDPDPTEWQRLDPRNLLLDPVKVLGQFLVPAVIAFVGLSSRDGGMPWWSVPIVVLGAVAFGVLPWMTTSWRVTATQFQKRTGLLNKTTSTAPLDRVRSVDLEASLLHRVLGLQKVQVGTGVDDDRITLDALSAADAQTLRTTLLRRREAAAVVADPGPSTDSPVGEPMPGPSPAPIPLELARIDWSWLRFAPFSLGRLVLLAGALGALSQFGDDLPIWNEETARSTWDWLTQFALVAVVLALSVAGLATWLVVSVAGYVVQWWRFLLVREHGSLHLTSGLVTTRSITVEEAKVRGVRMTEPLLMRAVGGAELSTLATGVEDGVTQVLPPCPREVAVDVGQAVLQHRGPLTDPLVAHGRLARRRAWLREVRGALVLVVAAVLAAWWFDLAWWWVAALASALLLAAAAVAEASYRHLGHALAGEHLVAGSGQLARIRTVLETDGIIGWVVSESWWQRRIGLADLVATTAAGDERVLVRDVRLDVGVALADAATPGLLADFVDR